MPRRLAQRVLKEVVHGGQFSQNALNKALQEADLDERDRRLATELVYGSLTWQRSIDAILERNVHQPLDSIDLDIHIALRLGVYQALWLDRIPSHAIVDRAVSIAKDVANPGASKLVNAVLREITDSELAEQLPVPDRDEDPVGYIGIKYSLPNWIANRLIQMAGLDRAERLARSFSTRPPIYVRATEPLENTDESDIFEAVPDIPGAYTIDTTDTDLDRILQTYPVFIQDIGNQLAGYYMGISHGERVLDACGGLGGKTLFVASQTDIQTEITSVDPKEYKLRELHNSVQRLEIDNRIETVPKTLQAFASNTDQTFDTVIVDAPCTGLGTIRRHPEIKWRRTEADIPERTELQKQLLEAGSELVDDWGHLIYIVCSFLVEEGPKQIDHFLTEKPEWTRIGEPTSGPPLDWTRYTDSNGDLVVDPADHNSDYFYAARLARKTS